MWIEITLGIIGALAGTTGLRSLSVRNKQKIFEEYLDVQMDALIERFGYDGRDVYATHEAEYLQEYAGDKVPLTVGFVYYHSKLLLDIIDHATVDQMMRMTRMMFNKRQLRDSHARLEAMCYQNRFEIFELREAADAYENVAMDRFKYIQQMHPLFDQIIKDMPRNKLKFLMQERQDKKEREAKQQETQKDWLKQEHARIEEERVRRFSLQTEAITLMRIVKGAEEGYIQRIASQETKEAAEAMANKRMTYEEIIILAAQSSEQMVSAQFSADEPYQREFLKGLVGDLYPVVFLRLMLAGFLIRHGLEAKRTVPMLMNGKLSLPIDEEGFRDFMTELGLPLTVEPLPLPEPEVEEIEKVEEEPIIEIEEEEESWVAAEELKSIAEYKETENRLFQEWEERTAGEPLSGDELEELLEFTRKYASKEEYPSYLTLLLQMDAYPEWNLDALLLVFRSNNVHVNVPKIRVLTKRFCAHGFTGATLPLSHEEAKEFHRLMVNHVDSTFTFDTVYTVEQWNEAYIVLRKRMMDLATENISQQTTYLRSLFYRYVTKGHLYKEPLSAHLEMQRYVDELINDSAEQPKSAYLTALSHVKKMIDSSKPNDDVADILAALEKQKYEAQLMKQQIEEQRVETEQIVARANALNEQRRNPLREHQRIRFLADGATVNVKRVEKDELVLEHWYVAFIMFLRQASRGQRREQFTDFYNMHYKVRLIMFNRLGDPDTIDEIQARHGFITREAIHSNVLNVKPKMFEDFLLKGPITESVVAEIEELAMSIGYRIGVETGYSMLLYYRIASELLELVFAYQTEEYQHKAAKNFARFVQLSLKLHANDMMTQ